MDALDRHKARVQRLQVALDRLTALHSQVYDLQGEIVALSKSDGPGRVERLDALHGRWRRCSRRSSAPKPSWRAGGSRGGREEDGIRLPRRRPRGDALRQAQQAPAQRFGERLPG